MNFRLHAVTVIGALFPLALAAQNKVLPIRALSVPFESKETFLATPNVRHLPDGKVLIDDSRGKRLIVFDSTLATFTITADSNSSNGVLYPSFFIRNALIPYLGDSTLFFDYPAKAILVINPTGVIARTMAHPASGDLMNLSIPFPGNIGVDNLGRLIYRSSQRRPDPKPGEPPITASRDTIAIVRADFNTRLVDTIATFSIPRVPGTARGKDEKGKTTATMHINPMLTSPDEWVITSDGTLAIVREHDYHIDYVNADGKQWSTPKLPLEWIRMTDELKLARIDSMKRVIDSINTYGPVKFGTIYQSTRRPEGGTVRDTIIPTITFVPLNEMPDYVTPIRRGSVSADTDGNVWIMPTTSAQAGPGLLYDVINRKGELFERVRLPAGCVLAGHGKGGIVYLARNNPATKTWTLLRTRIIGPTP
ncbi:MAG: hypothetical protein ABI852_00875 [Gemmatimonadaceae bacterium]